MAGTRLGAAAAVPPLRTRPWLGPPAIPPAAAVRAPTGSARSCLWAQEVGKGLAGRAYPAAWRSLRSPWRPRGPTPAAPRPPRRLLLHEPSGGLGGGDPTTLPKSAGSPSSHAAGGGARRTKREERGRRGGGLGAEGPRPGLGRPEVRSESAASDWWSTSSFQYASGLAEPLGQATKWRRGRVSWEVS